jgi:hypothetical protein
VKRVALCLVLVFFVSLMANACVNVSGQIQIVYPSPYWDYSPITPRVGDVVVFDASDFERTWNAGGESMLVSLVWDFGDGASASGALVTHTFTVAGTYLAGVTALDDRGYGGTSQFEIDVREQTPVTVYLSLSSDTIYTGQEVTLSGNLTHNSAGVADAWIVLSSKTYIEGAVWRDIATVKTDSSGNYLAAWKPTYGYYQVRASWRGDSTYPETSVSLILVVMGFGNLITDFSSNSTISDLNFNLTTRELSFSAEGPSGTVGYVDITLEKDPSFDPEGIRVFFDGDPLGYDVYSSGEFWILSFVYTHSIHSILVRFSADGDSSSDSPLPFVWQIAIYGVVAVALIVVLVGLLFYFKGRRKNVPGYRSGSVQVGF